MRLEPIGQARNTEQNAFHGIRAVPKRVLTALALLLLDLGGAVGAKRRVRADV